MVPLQLVCFVQTTGALIEFYCHHTNLQPLEFSADYLICALPNLHGAL